MTSQVNEVESVLSVDIGSVNTRALLYDVAGNKYRILAAGNSTSTFQAPIRDAREGIAAAIHHIEEITGRSLLDADHNLITPSSFVGSGVDRIAVTTSAGDDIRVIIAGLLEEFSLSSVEKLVDGIYARVVERFSLNDERKPEDRLNAFIQAEANLVIFAGGTNHGAIRAVLRILDQLRLGLQVSQLEKRPVVLFTGNESLAEKVKEELEKFTTVFIAPNVRPFAESEDTGPAEETLSQVINKIRSDRLAGFKEIEKISGMPIIPSVTAEARILRFQSLQSTYDQTVLGVNIGSAASNISAANSGQMDTQVFRGLGIGKAAAETLNRVGIESILRWLPMDIHPSFVRDYLWQKSLFPATIPMDEETLSIEQAAARAIIIEMRRMFPNYSEYLESGFEPILLSGAVISQAPTSRQSLMIALDGIQPGGISTVFSDRLGVMASLGACAPINQALVVQVLESGALTSLATVVSPVFRARDGEMVLVIRLQEEGGPEREFEINQGEITRIPLPIGMNAVVKLKPQKKMVASPGLEKPNTTFKAAGSELGIVIDTRGRPIRLPADPFIRREKNAHWIDSLQEGLS